MKRYLTLLGFALAATIMPGMPTAAVQLANGTVYFVQPPRLLGAVTTQNATNILGATYYFTLDLPASAGEPLQRVEITQRNRSDILRFALEETEAYAKDAAGKETKLTVSATQPDLDTGTISLTFQPAVAPGQTVTLGLRPWQNPDFGGVYLFGVTAFPPGEKSHGQFLGFGRLHFYDSGIFGFDRSWWFR